MDVTSFSGTLRCYTDNFVPTAPTKWELCAVLGLLWIISKRVLCGYVYLVWLRPYFLAMFVKEFGFCLLYWGGDAQCDNVLKYRHTIQNDWQSENN